MVCVRAYNSRERVYSVCILEGAEEGGSEARRTRVGLQEEPTELADAAVECVARARARKVDGAAAFRS